MNYLHTNKSALAQIVLAKRLHKNAPRKQKDDVDYT